MKNRVCFRFAFLLVLLSMVAGCGVRNEPDDCLAGVIRMQLNWADSAGAGPQGKWLVFYSDDKPTVPLVQEVGNEIYIDTLPPGRYRTLLLAMDKNITRLDFVQMKQIEQATLSLKELQGNIGLYPGAEMVFSEIFVFDLTKPIPGVVMLTPKPLVLNTAFAISIPEVREVQASLKGIPTEVNLWSRKAVYTDPNHYTVLTSRLSGQRITLSGSILMPTAGGQPTRTDRLAIWLEVDLTYNNGVKQLLTVDVTQALNEVAAEAPPEVIFELVKVGLSATIVGWETGTGQGDIIID